MEVVDTAGVSHGVGQGDAAPGYGSGSGVGDATSNISVRREGVRVDSVGVGTGSPLSSGCVGFGCLPSYPQLVCLGLALLVVGVCWDGNRGSSTCTSSFL